METKDILKQLRKNRGFNSAQDFCNAVGISINTYQNYESGKRIPTAEILIKLADFYGVTTDYLLGRDVGEPKPLDKLVAEFNMDELEKEILDNYLSLPKDMRGDLMEFLEKTVKNVMNKSGE
ncbi:MAG: helix-turn-helix domain-containing protein [Clostridium sp.]|nr:helix-turn-helix domain-containing protein [Clostridium sp.]